MVPKGEFVELTLDITGHTRLLGLVGTTVQHSMSPAMHTASFAKLGVDAVYLGFYVDNDQLEQAVKGLVSLGALGYNVTMPCKTYIGQYLDELSPEAELMGAVNTVVIKEGKSIGYNTDGAGFVQNMRLAGCDPKGKVATVIGAGGAGSAVFTQFALEGVKELHVFNQKDEFWDHTQQRIETLAQATNVSVSLDDLADRTQLARSITSSDIVVNATRVGMIPQTDACLVDEDMLHEGLFVADTVYEPHETKLIKMAKEHGLVGVGGLGMLLQQAALAERIWLGVDMPIDYIKETFF